MWGTVEATSEKEAIEKAKNGLFIGLVDSDPGKNQWHGAKAVEE